ncbi:MAG: fumarylacetoacetate hydrolase family protein, partial [Alphaproteobacteria bacterium]|nr:fumarylacetoacetate hydrolase family protein [Alphaproteobacteria bacterium]
MAFAIDPPAQPIVPVAGGDPFPVRRIYCVGRNYAAHAREMGHDPDREPPFFFMKPADAVTPDGSEIDYPPATADLHHEIELVVALSAGGADIAEAEALEHVFGYAVGLDMTRRDLQGEAKSKGRPWDTGKGFDQSAPIGAIRPAAEIGHPGSGRIWLSVNEGSRQDSDLSHMIW